MAVQILLRRGLAADWTSANPILGAGELGFETDTKKFKIGDGTTAWNSITSYVAGPESLRLQDLIDVAATAPSVGQVLKWNGTAWAPAADNTGGGGGGATNLADLADVADTLPTSGQVLKWDGTQWAPAEDAGGIAGDIYLADLVDVSGALPALGQVLQWDGIQWAPADNTADTDTTYSMSAEATFGGAILRLSGSDLSLDDVTFVEGNNITIAQTDANTITISSTDTGLTEIVQDQAPALGGNLNVGTFSITSSNDEDVRLAPTAAGNVVLAPTGSGSVIVLDKPFESAREVGQIAAQVAITSRTPVAQTGLSFRRAKGNNTSPTAVTTNDLLGRVAFAGWEGANFNAAATISSAVTNTPATNDVRSNFIFSIRSAAGSTLDALVPVTVIDEVALKTNAITALTTNNDLVLSGNGSGVVRLPAGSTVGGVAIGSFTFAGTTADAASRALLTPSTGQVWIQLDNLHGYLWDGSVWVDLGVLQGPQGATGATGPQGATGATGATGPAGADGADGADGKTILNGTVNPTTQGVDGDFYINTSSNTIFGPKASGVWPSGVSLVGPAGATGPAGADGADGANGTNGNDGVGISSIQRTSGTGAPGTTDTYTITYTNATTSTFNVYNGADGTGTTLDSLTDVDTSTTSPTDGQALVWNNTQSKWVPGTVSGGGGAGLGSRTTASATSAVLADGASADVTITGFKSYALLKVFVDQAAWVRIYTDTTAQGADSSRTEGVDPAPGSGVIAEVITTGSDTILISPATIGFNNELTPTTDIPVTITNKSGTSTTVTVTLTLIQLEA